jgi:hypothetical protein
MPPRMISLLLADAFLLQAEPRGKPSVAGPNFLLLRWLKYMKNLQIQAMTVDTLACDFCHY